MEELKKFITKLVQRESALLDSKINNFHRESLQHFRTEKEILTNFYNDIKCLREEIQSLRDVPAQRTFPLKTLDEVEGAARTFADKKRGAKLKAEIAYVLGQASKEEWLRSIFTDDVISQFHKTTEIRQLNFIQHIIANVYVTSKKNFTAMVTLAKGRVYQNRRRIIRKSKAAADGQIRSAAGASGSGVGKCEESGKPPSSASESSSEDDEDDGDGENEEDEVKSPDFSPLPKKQKK